MLQRDGSLHIMALPFFVSFGVLCVFNEFDKDIKGDYKMKPLTYAINQYVLAIYVNVITENLNSKPANLYIITCLRIFFPQRSLYNR